MKDKNRKHAALEGHERGRGVEIGEALKARVGTSATLQKRVLGIARFYSAGVHKFMTWEHEVM